MAVKEGWGSRVGLVLAMAGNAVGLGNFLRFPAQAVQNGGGAFLIPYFVSFLLMGIPLLWVEWAIGRHGGLRGHHSTPGMMQALGKPRWFKYLGVFGLFTNLTVAAFYCYLESWTLAYVWHSVVGTFRGMSPEQVSGYFDHYTDAQVGLGINFPVEAMVFFLITLGLNVWILSRGLSKGVEIASKIGMPLLILFGIILAIRSLTLDAGEDGAQYSAMEGLNYLWTPKFDSLTNPKVWLAAASQIFFTLSVGMGSIHCYASYVKRKQDIALNAASAGWMNEFVEVILGGSIVVPISAAYLGLAWVQDPGHVGLMMGFRTMPTLFNNWGWLAPFAGVMWFGLLFFAGITSSLAMGQPVMAFMQDEFRQSRNKSALTFGLWTFLLALPCILFFSAGAFDEFDWWAGSVALAVFALGESLIFAYAFGIDRGWEEITRGADMVVPSVFRFVIKYVTPLFLLIIFLGTLFKPEGGDFVQAFQGLPSWSFAPDSIIGSILHVGTSDTTWFAEEGPTHLFYIDATRMLLLCTFLALSVLVWRAFRNKPVTAGGPR
jgi:neurotransmitter:Na+ symporter, NSS family